VFESEAEVEEEEEETQIGSFSNTRWTPKMDIHAFASILFELVVGRPAKNERSVPRNIPRFVREIIERGLWMKSKREFTFHSIFKRLKQNEFRIEEGIDSAEVSSFVSCVFVFAPLHEQSEFADRRSHEKLQRFTERSRDFMRQKK
jgi:hypothetical protein